MSVETLFKDFTSLSEIEQRNFLDVVLSYLYGDREESAWKAELDRRMQAYENGTVAALNGQQVEKDLAEKYGVPLRPASWSEKRTWWCTRLLRASKQVSVELRTQFLWEFIELLDRICDAPTQFPPHLKTYRKARFIKKFDKYHIVFKVYTNSILIVAIAHDSRKAFYYRNRK